MVSPWGLPARCGGEAAGLDTESTPAAVVHPEAGAARTWPIGSAPDTLAGHILVPPRCRWSEASTAKSSWGKANLWGDGAVPVALPGVVDAF